jgi:hypothetical protein
MHNPILESFHVFLVCLLVPGVLAVLWDRFIDDCGKIKRRRRSRAKAG